MIALLIAAAVQHAAAPSLPNPNQFDLLCAGKTTVVTVNKVSGMEDTDMHLRLDLDDKVWCGGECKQTYPIEGVISPSEIVLNDSDQDQFASQNHGSNRFESHLHIDRASGALRSSNYAVSTMSGALMRSGRSTEATCRPAPFSGMPKPLF